MRLIHALALVFACLFALPAAAQTEIVINQGTQQPKPIAVPDFSGGDLGDDMARVIAADLERSGLFRPLNQASFIERFTSEAALPTFSELAGD